MFVGATTFKTRYRDGGVTGGWVKIGSLATVSADALLAAKLIQNEVEGQAVML